MFRRVALPAAALAAAAAAASKPSVGQAPSSDPRPSPVSASDSAAAHSLARSLQARFERLRVRRSPMALGRGGECDEIVGRLCIWDDGGAEWTPKPEHGEIARGRRLLLDTLAALAKTIPGDHWIFGQRIRYGVEAGGADEVERKGRAARDYLDEAELLARSCGLSESWRCDAYLGFVLHRRGRAVEAERVFDRALTAMPVELRGVWTSSKPVLGRELSHWLAAQGNSTRAQALVWFLADPLFLAPGNDRRTAHFSRWTHAMAMERARNPHGMVWGDDLAEVLVRYGWPVRWERHWPRAGRRNHDVTGRDAPATERVFPGPAVLGPPEEPDPLQQDVPVPWIRPEGHARTAYLPPYLDSLGSLDGQFGRFWRGSEVVLAAAVRVPTALGTPTAPRVRTGLFLAPVDSLEAPAGDRSGGAASSVGLAIDVRAWAVPGDAVRLLGRTRAPGWGVASVEAWWPKRRRGYRLRAGMGLRPLPPDLFALSDLVLLEPGAPSAPADFDQVPLLLRASTEVKGDETLRLAIELYGLGYRAEAVQLRAWVEDRDPGLLRRLARRLGLVGTQEEVALQWSEAGPDRPQPLFRTFEVRLPNLEPGRYAVVVQAAAPGRSPLLRRREFVVTDPSGTRTSASEIRNR